MSASKSESEVEPTATPETVSEETTAPLGGDTEKDEHTQLLEQLDALTLEANGYRDRALRAVAELENYRKRAIREKADSRKYANQDLMETFLPILDNFSMGLQAAQQHEAGKAFAEGFSMVLTQINGWLESNGVVCLNPLGQAFDPNQHESVAHLEHNQVPEGHVIEVNRIGYSLHDRLLRPAVVIVSRGPAVSTEG